MRVNHGSLEEGLQDERPVLGPTLRTADAYREVFEAMVELAEWNPMDTGEKCKFLQETLVEAGKLAINQNPQVRDFMTSYKSMRKLHKKCIVAESQIKQLECEEILQGFGSSNNRIC